MKNWSEYMKKSISVTIKPTHNCNMRCKHCFNGKNLNNNCILPISSACIFIKKLAEEYSEIAITFHGGEPTLAGEDFYKEYFEYQNKLKEEYGTIFHNNFTTNGLALTNDLIKLLIENDVLINLSFDGPHNDILREYTELILNKIKLLQEKKARLRIYCVETAKSYKNLFETYNWFKENNLDFKMVPVQPMGNAMQNTDLIMNPYEFVREWMKLYKFWLTDKTCNIKFYTFEEFIVLNRNEIFKTHWFYRKLALNPDGKIYPFGRPNDMNYCLGTPETIKSIEDCFESDKYKLLMKTLDIYMKKYCSSCDSNFICNGVSLCSSFVYDDNDDVLSYGCKLSNEIFQNVLNINDKVIENIKNGEYIKYSDIVLNYYKDLIK